MKHAAAKRRHKYGAVATIVDNIRFPSLLEAGHYRELRLLESSGIIKELRWQVDFPLNVNGILICTYRADFVFIHMQRGKYVILESKGKETNLFQLKWKLCKALYPDYDHELIKKKSINDLINLEGDNGRNTLA